MSDVVDEELMPLRVRARGAGRRGHPAVRARASGRRRAAAVHAGRAHPRAGAERRDAALFVVQRARTSATATSIAVKREPDGRGGSISMVDQTKRRRRRRGVAAAQRVRAAGRSAPSYIFIAGGIGITPIRSMIAAPDRTSGTPFKLYYLSARAVDDRVSRRARRRPRFAGKVVMHHDDGDPDQRVRPVADAREAEGRARLLLRPAAADGSGARHDGPLVDVGGALRGLRARARPRALSRTSRSRCASNHGERDRSVAAEHVDPRGAACARRTNRRARARAAPAARAACGSLAGDADHRDLVLSDDERPRKIMVCVSRARSRRARRSTV